MSVIFFPSLYIYIHILLLNNWATSSTYFLYLLFFSKLFFSLLSTKKQKPFLLPISTHLRTVTLHPDFPFSFCLFTSPYYSLLHCYTSFIIFTFFIIWLFFFPFYLYTSTITLPPTILFPLYLFTSPTTLYFIITIPSSFSLFYNLTLLLLILFVHTYGYTSSNFFLPSLPLYLPHYSLPHRYTSFIIFSFL